MDKKQKQIEEMASIICKETSNKGLCKKCDFKKHRQFDFIYQCSKFDNAEALYNAGYRKIPEGAVVLTEEEYERLLKEETLCERLGNDVDVKLKYIYELEDKVAQERKETAKKIMNDISSDILVIDTKEYGNIEVVPMERLQEICNDIIDGE